MTQSEPVNRNRTVFFQKKWVQAVVLAAIGGIFYLLLGQEWVVIEKDSAFYMDPTLQNGGVMPLYPLFLFGIRCIFGEVLYLDAAVVIQSLFAIICTMIFVFYLQNTFRMRFAETVLCFFFTMLPFSIELPRVWITHQIMTESIAYALIYIYFVFVLQYVFDKKRKWIFWVTMTAVLMGLLRSQLVFLLIVTAILYVCVEFVKNKEDKENHKSRRGRCLAGAVINLCIGIVCACGLVVLIYQLRSCYVMYAVPAIGRIEQRTKDSPDDEQKETVEGGSEAVENGNTEDAAVQGAQTEQRQTMSQMTQLIVIRGLYEADREDSSLFDTPEMQEIFIRVYSAIDALQYRYEYARQDLYIWQDLVKDKIAGTAYAEIQAYLEEHPEVSLDPVLTVRELGMKVLLRHFDRYLYHTMRLMVSGFISSVFFQIGRIYLLCHIVTLFLFAIDIAGVVYCIRYREDKKTAVFALVTVCFIVLMVGIINLVFIGLQRYMVYAMGIFYCSLYLLLKEWGLPWIRKKLKF